MWVIENIECIDIELTSFCNIKCPACFRSQSDKADKIINKHILDFDIIKKRFKKEDFKNLTTIIFCGTIDEPTMHPQFFNIMEYFADWGCKIYISTNGSTRTKEQWAKLAKVLPSDHRVIWGIDGSDETSEIYRQGSNFKKVQENFRSFIAAGGKAIWQFIEFEHNEHQIEEARKIAEEEGFVEFIRIVSHRAPLKDLKYKRAEFEENLEIKCRYLDQKRLFLNHNGNLIPCAHLNPKMLLYTATNKTKDLFEEILRDNDYINKINIYNESIKNILESDVYKKIINSWTNENKIPQCIKTCKKNNRDKFIKESLNENTN